MMSKRFKRLYQAQWLFVRGFLVVWTFGILVFVAMELLRAISEGSSKNWTNIGMGLVMLAGGFVLAWFGRHWFNLLAGEEICLWRYRK